LPGFTVPGFCGFVEVPAVEFLQNPADVFREFNFDIGTWRISNGEVGRVNDPIPPVPLYAAPDQELKQMQLPVRSLVQFQGTRWHVLRNLRRAYLPEASVFPESVVYYC